ncbi:MAG: hypothetical protein D3908_00415 [Candidatus Electrothrix sp. AUS4]|nr:hypothetical protein [Candidatus Electrothrix sp. AUS4]
MKYLFRRDVFMKYSFFVIYIFGIIVTSGCHHEPPVTDNSVSSAVTSPSDDDTKKQKGNRALVIGINNYSDQRRIPNLKDLNHAVDDALAIKTRLKNMGFEVDVLPDEQATKNGIFRKLSEYRTMGCNSQFILFYSGHGTTDDQEGYIVSSDGAKISFDELRQKTIDLPPKHILYIFDSCHSGFFDPAVQAKWTCKKPSCALPQRQERESRPAVYTLTAGSSNEETMEAESKWFGHSYFTYHLLKGLDGAADINNDCKITASELGVYLTQAIPLQQIAAEDVITAKQIGNNETPQRQNPLFNRVFGEGEISFTPPRCKENQKASPQQQQLFPDKTWETSDAYKGQPSAYREPTQLLVDSQNNLYVLDTPAGKVHKFDAEGKYLLSYSHENRVPTSMALLDNDDPVKKRYQRNPNRVKGRYLRSRAFYNTTNNETVNSSASSKTSSLWVYYSSDERGKVVIYEGEKEPRQWEGKDRKGKKKQTVFMNVCIRMLFPNKVSLL